MAKFRVTILEEWTYNIELAQTVLDAVDDDWRANFYSLNTPEDIAAHIARNMHAGMELSQMDGFADQPSTNAHLETIGVIEDYWAEAL